MSVTGHDSVCAAGERVSGRDSGRPDLRSRLAAVWEVAGTPARVLIVAWALLPLVIAIGVMRLPWHAQGQVFWQTDSGFVPLRHDPAADNRTKADIGTLGSLMEECFARHGDFTACDSAAELPRAVAAGIALGSGRGKIEVAAVSRRAYRLIGTTQGGGRYVLSRSPSGSLRHTCSYDGVSACSSRGSW
jgi:hypothetical protein